MWLLNKVFNSVMSKRYRRITTLLEKPVEVQEKVFGGLMKMGESTQYGRKYGIRHKLSPAAYAQQVPITTYEDLYPYIEKHLKGERGVLWPTKIKWFAKSSGTTNDRSKYIPVSRESLYDCHYRAGKDALAVHLLNRPNSRLLEGKYLTVGGSLQQNHLNSNTQYGDVSAVITYNLPFWAEIMRTPPVSVALMDKWEEKISRMAEISTKQNVVSLAGVPTWTLVLLERVLEMTGSKNLLEVWPNLECFAHGAVAFGPYREAFRQLIPSDDFSYIEIYNASEGFFGIQLSHNTPNEMALMLDHGVYYEFIPMNQLYEPTPKAIPLAEVEADKNYAMVITTNGGLWRYMIGDTIKFTSIKPYYFKITGRTKHFINAFGEEVVVENADAALSQACKETGAMVKDYTAGPVYLQRGKQGGHEWIIEFERQPINLDDFANRLDGHLRQLNSDYDAKRSKDIALVKPIVHPAPIGTFYAWLKQKGKLGGQHKVPRLANDRKYLEQILPLIGQLQD